MTPKTKAVKAPKLQRKISPTLSESEKPPRVRREKREGSKIHRRSRNGCYTCRLRRKKCDEALPKCRGCRHLGLDCEFARPFWWEFAERRAQRKEEIKEHIRKFKPPPQQQQQQQQQKRQQQKTQPVPAQLQQSSQLTPTPTFTNTPPSLCHSLPTTADTIPDPILRTQVASPMSQFSPQFNLDTPRDFFHSTPMMPPPQWTPAPTQFPFFSPFEVDIKTERQIFVNDIPTRRDSTISTFTTLQPPTPTVTLPSFPPEAWMQHERHETTSESFVEEMPMVSNFFEYSHRPLTPSQQAVIEIEDCDRHLLDHFLENVAPMTFSILDVNQKGSALSDVVLPQLEINKVYLHCCLSISALHLKVTEHIEGEQIDNDIMRHRAATISELCKALSENADHSQMLEATLGMILFQSSVGSQDDGLPDIPWHQHFQAATDLLEKIELQTPTSTKLDSKGQASFNSTLASWIDILGATMLKRVPVFSNSYREKNEASVASGFVQLMGCDDEVMYLISEIACLDALIETMKMDDLTLCTYITDLGGRLSGTETNGGEVASAYLPATGSIRPKQLSQNITAIFRNAARIYLCSLVPAFDRYSESIMSLVDAVADAMAYIPVGRDGFDRALVWPLLMAGSFSVESSPFRKMFAYRSHELGPAADFGSFGRLKDLLTEVWRINDSAAAIGETQCVHWRDIMSEKGWDFLLI